MIGRTVRLFMADGSALGIRQCEIINRTIHALAVSRGRFPELREWSEANRPGVYFLFGKSEDGSPQVYIGEAMRVFERISAHIKEKEFWNEAVVFVNKDENLNAKYLEARQIQEATNAGRYILDNGKEQKLHILSRSETAAMEEVIPDIRLILGVLGHLVFEPVGTTERQEQTTIPAAPRSKSSLIGHEFTFGEAKGRVTDEGFLVLKGSLAAPRFTAGSAGYRRTREGLESDGTLVPHGEKLILTKDYLADSSSQAAAIIAGGNRSGPQSWKSDGKTLQELEGTYNFLEIPDVLAIEDFLKPNKTQPSQ